MDKKLTDNDKKSSVAAEQEAPYPSSTADLPAAGFAEPGYSIGAYGDLSGKAWGEEKPWNQSVGGRLAIRTFSRGVLGAAFFTVGGMLTKKWMNTSGSRYRAGDPWSEQDNPLKFMAKLIDTAVGKPIEWSVAKVAGPEMGKQAVTFRPTRAFGMIPGGGQRQYGQSLGAEAVGITFDFFCASIGDAWGRDLAGWLDPNAKRTWLRNGHFSLPEALNALVDSTVRYVTYHGGEDWAVAIPYAYYMKGQRAVIDKYIAPGFKYDFDRSLNGSSFQVDEGAKVTGNYAAAGMLDLQGRFTAYNVGTLMFREAYDYADNRLNGKKASLYGAPDAPDRKKGILGGLGTLAKWSARSAVKAVIYMTPAVPFFWITRSTQQKREGTFIHPEHGLLTHSTYKGGRDFVTSKSDIPSGATFSFSTHREGYLNKEGTPFERGRGFPLPPESVAVFSNFNNAGVTPFQKAMDYEARFNDRLRVAFHRPAGWMDENLGRFGSKIKTMLGYQPLETGQLPGFSRFTNNFVNASVSYTPYMIAKGEFSRLWDDGKMDLSAERMIDGAASLNWGEFKAGAGEVWHSFMHKPLADPKREAEAKRRKKLDTSPPSDVARPIFGNVTQASQRHNLSWQQRLVVGQKEEGQVQAGQAETKSKPVGFTEKEDMRKALKDMEPPTNSIN